MTENEYVMIDIILTQQRICEKSECKDCLIQEECGQINMGKLSEISWIDIMKQMEVSWKLN